MHLLEDFFLQIQVVLPFQRPNYIFKHTYSIQKDSIKDYKICKNNAILKARLDHKFTEKDTCRHVNKKDNINKEI